MAVLAGAFAGLTLALETEIARDLLPAVVRRGAELSSLSAVTVIPMERGGWWMALAATISPLVAAAVLRWRRASGETVTATVLAVSFAWLCVAALAAGGLFLLFNHGIRLTR